MKAVTNDYIEQQRLNTVLFQMERYMPMPRFDNEWSTTYSNNLHYIALLKQYDIL